MIQVDDYSTETGLRIRLYSEACGIALQMTAEEWHDLVDRIKAGELDGLALEPKRPFIY